MTTKTRHTFPRVARHARVNRIHQSLVVFMTAQTGKFTTVGRIVMARGAVRPGSGVPAGVNWELHVVIRELTRFSPGVTREACHTLPRVARHAGVYRSH
jgi:hypothetical protein